MARLAVRWTLARVLVVCACCWVAGISGFAEGEGQGDKPLLQVEVRRSLTKRQPPKVSGNAEQAFVAIVDEIGAITLRPPEGGTFPKSIRLRLHVKGLESLKVRRGQRTAEWALSSVDPVEQRATVQDGDAEGRVLEKDNPWWARLEIAGEDGQLKAGERRIPLAEGQWIEIDLPAAVLEGGEPVDVEWVDFYR
jgi:hypothetical protein